MSMDRARVAPTADPNYLGASGGPLNIRPDMTGAALFEGLANITGAVVQGADTVIQNRIQRDVWSMFDQEVGAQGVDSRVEEVTGFGGPPVETAPVPQSILGQGRSFARLQQAYEEGRISDSYYYARLEAGVRQLRAKYPGYREQIDQMVSSVTGVQPANALRRSLLQEFADAERQAQSQQEKYQTFVQQNMQFAAPFLEYFQRGELPPEAEFRSYVAVRRSEMEDVGRQRTLIEFGNLTEEQNARTASRAFTLEANGAIQEMIDTAWGSVQRIQNLGGEASATDRESLRQEVARLRAAAEMRIDQVLNAPIGDTGRTYATLIGQEEAKRIRDQQLQRVQTLTDALENENFGILNLDRNITRAKRDENIRQYLDQFPVFEMHQTLREIGGGELLNNLMLSNPQFMGDTVAAVSAIAASRMALGQTNLNEAVQEINKLEVAPAERANLTNGVIDRAIATLLDQSVSDNVLANTVRAIFGPEGRNLMGDVREKDVLLRIMADPRIAQRVSRLDPETKQLFNGTLQDWFTTVHRTDLADIRNEATQGGPLQLIRDPNGLFRYELTEEGRRLPPNHPTRSRVGFDPLLDRVNRSQSLIAAAMGYTGGNLDQFNQQIDQLTATGAAAEEPPARERDPAEILSEEIDRRAIEGLNPQGENPADLPAEGASESSLNANSVELGEDGSIRITPFSPEELAMAEGYSDAEREEESDEQELTRLREELQASFQATSGGSSSPQIQRVKPLLDLIGRAEAPGGYNQIFGRNRFAPLDQMTVGQVLQMQRQMVSNGSPSSAVGRYQFIRRTLEGLVNTLGIDRNTKFTSELQDRLALALLERRGLSRFLRGEISERRFKQNLSMEWAGLPSLNGRSFYAGDGLNRSTVGSQAVVAALAQLRS